MILKPPSIRWKAKLSTPRSAPAALPAPQASRWGRPTKRPIATMNENAIVPAVPAELGALFATFAFADAAPFDFDAPFDFVAPFDGDSSSSPPSSCVAACIAEKFSA